ncbi:MAG: hypothetical protein AAF439_08610 [Pseudomonadota bacterium]
MEFIVVFPLVIYIIFLFSEVAVLTARSALLMRGVAEAITPLRLGEPFSEQAFKESICAGALFIVDCVDSLMVEVEPIDVAAFSNSGPFKCVNSVDPDIQPAPALNPGEPEEIMVVRVCLLVNPLFPGSGIGASLAQQHNGEYAIVATSAFMNEPS